MFGAGCWVLGDGCAVCCWVLYVGCFGAACLGLGVGESGMGVVCWMFGCRLFAAWYCVLGDGCGVFRCWGVGFLGVACVVLALGC